MSELFDRIEKLEEQIRFLEDKPKPKDNWDKFATVTSFMASVLLAGVATIFTVLYQSDEAKRRDQLEQTRSQQQNYQNKVRELEAVAKFVPYLTGADASEESKKLSIIALDRFASTGIATQFAEVFPSLGTVAGLKHIRADATAEEKKTIDAALDRIRVEKAKDVSGIACMETSGFPRHCLIATTTRRSRNL